MKNIPFGEVSAVIAKEIDKSLDVNSPFFTKQISSSSKDYSAV